MGSPAKQTITFSATQTEIVKKGEEISNEHLSKVQNVVKSYLEELEQETSSSKQRELEHITLNIASTKAETDMAITELQAQADEESTAVRSEKMQPAR